MEQPWQWFSDLLFGEPPTDTNHSDNTRHRDWINLPGSSGTGQRDTIHQADTDGS